MFGLYPVKERHITSWSEEDYTPTIDDIPNLHRELLLAARDFLRKELKWKEEISAETHWS